MLHRLWLVFAQTATICPAALFVVATLKPEWLPGRPALQPPPAAPAPVEIASARSARGESLHDAVSRATPSVVNIFTSKEVPRSPMLSDPLFRRFFGDLGEEAQRATNLGSGVIVSAAG